MLMILTRVGKMHVRNTYNFGKKMKTIILESTFNLLQKEEKEQLIQQGEVRELENGVRYLIIEE